jgi:Domain of unknown function (DUF4234)
MSVSSSSSPSTAAASPPATADQIPIAPGSTAKIRGPVTVVILSVVTLGIYVLFWWYFVNREMADYGRARGTNELGDNPTKSLLALRPGSLVVVPAIWTMVTTFRRIQAAQSLNGQTPVNGWLGFVLAIVFSPVLYGYMQSGLNSTWRAIRPAAD